MPQIGTLQPGLRWLQRLGVGTALSFPSMAGASARGQPGFLSPGLGRAETSGLLLPLRERKESAAGRGADHAVGEALLQRGPQGSGFTVAHQTPH